MATAAAASTPVAMTCSAAIAAAAIPAMVWCVESGGFVVVWPVKLDINFGVVKVGR
jgi:hypothetical protein